MASQWPLVHARLVALVEGLDPAPDATYDGPPVTGDSPTTYATVGYVYGEDSAGEFTTDTTNSYQIAETGSVRGEFVATDGAPDALSAVRAKAFALTDALEAAVRSDRTLGGVLSAQGTATLRVDVVPSQTTSGAMQRLSFTLDYFTVT